MITILSKWLYSSIWLIGVTLTGITAPGMSGLESNYNEGVLHIPQNSRTNLTIRWSLVPYSGLSKRKFFFYGCHLCRRGFEYADCNICRGVESPPHKRSVLDIMPRTPLSWGRSYPSCKRYSWHILSFALRTIYLFIFFLQRHMYT